MLPDYTRSLIRVHTSRHLRSYKLCTTLKRTFWQTLKHNLCTTLYERTRFMAEVLTPLSLSKHTIKRNNSSIFLSYLIHSFSRMVAMMLHFVIYVKAWSRVLIRAAPDSSFPDEGSGHSQLVGGLLSCGCPCVSSGLSGVFHLGTRCSTC